MSLNLAQWIAKLTTDEYNQAHLVQDVDSWSEDQKQAFLDDINACEQAYPGGILNYVQRARVLLKQSAIGFNPFAGFEPTVPQTTVLRPGTDEFETIEKIGLDHLHEMTYVLVAGGLGERLGYPGIKVSLPTDVVTMKTYLQYYAEYIIALDKTASRVTGTEVVSPLAIMTSDDTYSSTVKLLESNDYFSLGRERVVIMKQEKVPAVYDSEARISQCESSKSLNLKPHGHGDVHQLLIKHGLPEKWVAQGKKYMLFFQDTNALVFRILVATLGTAVRDGLVMNTICIPRKAQEAVGGICKLINKAEGKELTINVEYNQLGPMLSDTGLGGDVADPETGNSKYPGNTNALLFNLPRYSEVMKETGGNIPEFVNPKYADSTKTTFKSPTRLECMMQEYPRLLKTEDKVGCVETDRFMCFSTVKNHYTDAITKIASGNTAECAFSAEADFYESNAKLFEIAAKRANAKASIAQSSVSEFLGVNYALGPKIVLHPSFGVCLTEMQSRFKEGSTLVIHPESTLIIDGECLLSSMDVQGAVRIQKDSQVNDLVVRNKGISLEKVNDDADIHLKIRGYT